MTPSTGHTLPVLSTLVNVAIANGYDTWLNARTEQPYLQASTINFRLFQAHLLMNFKLIHVDIQNEKPCSKC